MLINNAGYSKLVPIEDDSEASLRAMFDANFFGAVTLTKALLPHFRKRGTGTIVNLSSMASELGLAGVMGYAASKAAMNGQRLRMTCYSA